MQWKSLASMLIQNVNKDLDLQQSDFFGLQFSDREDNSVFLDPTKRIDEQIKCWFIKYFYNHDINFQCLFSMFIFNP